MEPSPRLAGAISPDFVLKLIIIGDAGCGKSALLHYFVEGRFKDGTPKHTIGVEFGTKVLQISGKRIKLHIWDTSGQERFRSVTHSYYRGAVGALLVYDMTNRATFENMKNWLLDIRTLAGSDVSIILCGNKSDLDGMRQVSLLEGSRFAQENDCMFLETSAVDGSNVEEVFYKCVKTILNKVELGVFEQDSPILHGGSLRNRQGKANEISSVKVNDEAKSAAQSNGLCC
jgi:Ras-related protein Rab-4B